MEVIKANHIFDKVQDVVRNKMRFANIITVYDNMQS